MPERLSLSQRIAQAELAIEQCDQRLHELTLELKPSAKRALHAHGKTAAVSAVVLVIAGLVIYPRRAAIVGSQFTRAGWALFKAMGVPWLMQKAAAHAAIDEHEAQQEEVTTTPPPAAQGGY